MKYLQRLGKSLMLPVSIMPIAALLKGIGYWIDPTGWGIHNPIAALLIAAGGAIIDNLPILFAIAVAMEMSKKRDTAIVLSALACYMMMTTILSSKCIALILQIPEYAVESGNADPRNQTAQPRYSGSCTPRAMRDHIRQTQCV